MRSFRLSLLALLVATPCWAQLSQTGAGHVANGGGGVSFQGPGDIASGAIAFYSDGRAYNLAYATAKSSLADLVDTTTGLLTCTLKVGTNGYADLTTAYCPTASPIVNVVTWCTVIVNGCSITKHYDQTGNGNHVVQATLANMPALTFNAQNGLPCAAGTNNASMILASAGNITQAAPFTETAVAERTGSFTTVQRIIVDGTTARGIGFTAVANQMTMTAGTPVLLTASDNTFHAAIGIVSAIDPLFAIDSSANTSTSTSGTNPLGSTVSIGGRGTGGQGLLSGFVCEAGIWPADLNSSYQAMLANMRSASVGWNF